MRGRRQLLALMASVCVAAGCQSSPRYVSRGPDEGIVAIPADTAPNRRTAEKLMSAHFPNGYDVVYEYEERVGETTRRVPDAPGQPPAAVQQAAYQAVPPAPGIRRPRTRLETVDKTEWRIRYRRKGAPAVAPRGGTSISHILPQK
jgi:hypothetical protein